MQTVRQNIDVNLTPTLNMIEIAIMDIIKNKVG